LSLAPARSAYGFFVWLALAVVLAPALDPVGSPFREVTGSAFNAFTSDVSLGPSRAAPPERERKYRVVAADVPDLQGVATTAVVLVLLICSPRTAAAVAAGLPLRSGAGPGLPGGRAFQARAPPPVFKI
jgi:hypothetical protein